ncbi:uncharacterized protein LOC115780811 [Archocentrus centrarchus]|uniref:uncharacterized protein LOC115780811 n=1 Tax=Archocentrus centrarchus TaxID=63155 RepID=UPI0011EA128B|nr:uncharacterized protein LOC115780811 [Archocentrus centrarchus]
MKTQNWVMIIWTELKFSTVTYGRSPRLPVDMLFSLTSEQGDSNHHDYIEKWKQGMEEAYEITRENTHKTAMRSKRHYDSKVKSSVLQPGDRVLVRNMTPRGGPGKLRNHWEDTVHTVVRQIEIEVRPQTRKKAVETSEEVEQSEEEDDDDEYYPVSPQQPSQPRHHQMLNPVSADGPAEHLQAKEIVSGTERQQGAVDQCEDFTGQEGSCAGETEVEDLVPSPAPSECSRTSEQEPQRPSRQRKPPKIFTYDRLGSPACYNMRTLPQHSHSMVPWTRTSEVYYRYR